MHGFAPLGPADGPVKRAILGETSAKMYGIAKPEMFDALKKDAIEKMKAEYQKTG